MQSLDGKKAVMTDIIDSNDLGFSDWESFTDDIDIASLEQSLQMTESETEKFNDKINFLSDRDYHSQKRGDGDLYSFTCSKVETSDDESFKAQLRNFMPSLDSNTLPVNPSNLSIGGESHFAVFLKSEPRTESAHNLPRKIYSCISNATTRNMFLPYEKSPTSDAEKSFSSPYNLQLKCTARDQRPIVQEYTNYKDKNIFLEKSCESRMQNEENQNRTEILPHVSRLGVFDIQENGVSNLGSEKIVSGKVITSNQKNIPSEENISCKNIFPFPNIFSKENFDSERKFFISEENFDSQKMVISSQESSDGQQMIISSQEYSDSQRMITSSQESSGGEKMITSSQEFSDSQKMITSSQDISDSQKMIVSSQDSLDDQRVIILNQESFGSQKMIISSQESFDSKNFKISKQVPEDIEVIPSCQETPVRHKMFNTRSSGFLKISKKINLKTENKSFQSLGSRLSLKDKKIHRFQDFKGVMTTKYNGNEVPTSTSIGKKFSNAKEAKFIHIGELKVRKIEIGMNKQKTFISSKR